MGSRSSAICCFIRHNVRTKYRNRVALSLGALFVSRFFKRIHKLFCSQRRYSSSRTVTFHCFNLFWKTAATMTGIICTSIYALVYIRGREFAFFLLRLGRKISRMNIHFDFANASTAPVPPTPPCQSVWAFRDATTLHAGSAVALNVRERRRKTR